MKKKFSKWKKIQNAIKVVEMKKQKNFQNNNKILQMFWKNYTKTLENC